MNSKSLVCLLTTVLLTTVPLAATAGLNADLPPTTIFDFSFAAAAAKEIAAKK